MGRIDILIAERIKERELREGRRLPLAEVARAAGVAPGTLASLVDKRATRISFAVLAALCTYFGCTPGDLLHHDTEPDVLDEDEVESRDIVARWERTYGVDEHPPEQLVGGGQE